MIATLAAALSLATSVAIEVPYVPQTDALCGGAAAAMVFRYWGDRHADAREFAPLVDRRAGGIGNRTFTDAVRQRGWQAIEFSGGRADLQRRLADRQPVIVLLADRGTRYHYVVVVGETANAVIIHDPSWGPSRTVAAAEFDRLWRPAGFWGLVILPTADIATLKGSRYTRSDIASPDAPPTTSSATLLGSRRVPQTLCEARLSDALEEIRGSGFDHADAILTPLQTSCPKSSGPWRELAGVRFAQQRWSEAAALAREALARDPDDPYALDVLGSSLFMLDDPVGALRAWNRIGKPVIDLVRITGVDHTRHQAIAAALDIQPNALLTADKFERAKRRLEDWPDRSNSRLALRPDAIDGFATVDVVLLEHASVPRSGVDWTAAGARAAATQSIGITVPGGTGYGELWSFDWRFWNNRPGLAVAFDAPRSGRLPGVWRVEASWSSERFAFADAPSAGIRESRLHGGLAISNWLTPAVRYSFNSGFDAWSATRKTASIGATIERRWFNERLTAEAHATDAIGIGASESFRSGGWRARLQSSAETHGWIARGTIGADHVSTNAPLAVWPGAGEGQARAALLRAHPLMADGTIELDSSTFGRSLVYGTAEVQRWFDRPLLLRVGLAGFIDAARATRRADGTASPVRTDVGGGLRLRIPGAPGVLRVDAARGVRDGARALSVGWQF